MKNTSIPVVFKAIIGKIIVLALLCIPAQAGRQLKMGVAYTSYSGMAERVLAGFIDEMKTQRVPMELEYKTGLADLDVLAREVRAFEKTKDAILIMRSTGAGWLAKNPTRIPTFVAACNHPGQLGVIKNMNAPEGNVTGATYYLPRDVQWEIFRAILPDIHSIFLILEKGHPSSMVDHRETQAICKKLGIDYRYRFCTSLDDALATIEKNQHQPDAFVLGTQSLSIDNTDRMVARFPHLVFLSYSSKQVENGALAGFVANDEILGRKLAISVKDILVDGKPFHQVPVKFDERPKFLLNVLTAERLHIEIPFEILRTATLIGK